MLSTGRFSDLFLVDIYWVLQMIVKDEKKNKKKIKEINKDVLMKKKKKVDLFWLKEKGKEADLWQIKTKENIQYKPGKMKIEW